MKPAKDIEMDHIFPDEENMSVFVLVSEEQKPLAIGLGGRNVRLASRIVGWDIEIKTPAEYEAELMSAEGRVPEEAKPVPEAPAQETGVAAEDTPVEVEVAEEAAESDKPITEETTEGQEA